MGREPPAAGGAVVGGRSSHRGRASRARGDHRAGRRSAAVSWARRRLDEVTGGGPVYPLLILFGLNAVDELDRTAFGILLPEIRDEFGLDLTSILALVAIVAAGALVLQVPIAPYADRHRRAAITLAGAGVCAIFSAVPGLVSPVL